jgi:hypothetical protein
MLGVAPLTLSLNGQQYLESAANFSFYESNQVLSLSPSVGSSVGGTIVTVTGTHFRSFPEHAIRCRFGMEYAVASLVDYTSLECVAPAATAAGVATEVRIDFAGASATVGALFGSANIAGGVLELTPAAFFQTGAFVFSVPRQSPFRWFRLTLFVNMGGSERSLLTTSTPLGGMGWSLNFGMLPAAPFGERGTGDGLRLCFFSANTTMTVMK